MQTPSTISLDYQPRKWQKTAHEGLRGKKYGCLITSRQIGKTTASIAMLCSRALAGPPHTAHCYLAPTANQARRICWSQLKERLAPLGTKVKFRESDLVVTLPGDRKIFVIGAEQGDNIRGASFRSIFADEFDSISDEFWRSVMIPTTAAHGDQAFILFIGTIGGGISKLWNMYIQHKADPDWFCMCVPASKSGCFTPEELEEKRRQMSEAAYMREMEADPNAPVENAVLGREVKACQDDNRIVDLPYRQGYAVHTCWDIGIRDFTSVWGFMIVGRMIEVLFYREYSEIGMLEVMARLKEEFRHYTWGEATLPHDAKNRDKLTADSILGAFWEQWPGTAYAPKSAPNPIATLQSTRTNFPRLTFDEVNCDHGIKRLKTARYVVNAKTGTVTDTILHDDNSHCVDAIRLGMWRLESLYPVSETEDYVPWGQHGDQGLTQPNRYFE
jgi:hypothetical protein